MWPLINRALNTFFDIVLWPFQWVPATIQILVLALPATALALLVFRYSSNQSAIAAAKDKIKAYLLEMRIYRDDLSIMVRAQGRILRHVLTYMRLALLPMAVMVVPFILMIVQVESRYAFRSLNPGERAILSLKLDGNARATDTHAAVFAPPGLSVETPALRRDDTGEVFWRLRAVADGEYEVRIRIDEAEYSKNVVVGKPGTRISPSVYRADALWTLAYPMERALDPDAAIAELHLDYPRDRAVFAGLSTATWILFGSSLVLGFALRGFFDVTF